MINRAFVAVTLAAAVFAALISNVRAETTLEQIQRTKAMTAGNNFEYPPFSYVEDGKKVGFDVDLGSEIAKRMGVRLEFLQIEFKGLIASLKSKRIDIILSALAYSPERATQISFSEQYFDAGIGAAHRSERPIANPEDLSGLKIGVQSGSVGDMWLRQNHKSLLPNVRYYDTVNLAVKDLEAGRIDAVVHPMPTMRYVARNPNVRFTSVWDSRKVGINTRLEDTDLLTEINKQLIAVKKDGTYDQLVKKWFGNIR